MSPSLGLTGLLSETAIQMKCTDVHKLKQTALCSPAQCGTSLIVKVQEPHPKKDFLSSKCIFPLTLVTNHSVLCFSWLLPPNTLVKMMMSDMNFYISPQLASCPPLSPFNIYYRKRVDTWPSVTRLSLLPSFRPHTTLPPCLQTQTSLLPPVSQPATIILNASCLFFNCRLRIGTEKSRV